MSTGPLPYAKYHRAAHLGAGTFGSVVTVYNDDGEEYALKLFLDDDDDEDNEEEFKPICLGALREISCLRLLRGQHENIVNLIDIQPEWCEEEGGAGTSGCLGMALPLYRTGSLADAIERKTFLGYPKKAKVEVAHGILSALAFLHDNGILHRDIKSDNVLMDFHDEMNERFKPVLIDFSLAKPINNVMWRKDGDPFISTNDEADQVEHTGEVGTIVYNAPEIVNNESYGKPADVFSVGVVLLELLQNEQFSAIKNKEAALQIKQALDSLPTDAPFPNLVRSLLREDPDERPTARQALEHPLFTEKFKLSVPPVKHINIANALPYENDSAEENESPNIVVGKNPGKKKTDPKLEKRQKLIEKLCSDLSSNTNPYTKHAALEYSQLLEQLDDNIDNVKESQSLLDCVILAHRFFDLETRDLKELDEEDDGRFALWSLEEYVDNESTIFMMTDYCLYPRKLSV